MIIKSISLKNFKSFGNGLQTVEFKTTGGELILINGGNGHGKSSFQQSFDFALFGVVRGKNGKKVPMSILPNWINKELFTSIEFLNNNSQNIKITRELEPKAIMKVLVDSQDETKNFKIEKEKILGFDFDTYKNFISMTVSDFANFIDLSPQEKRQIINKLFNLQDLDKYLSLTNEMIKIFDNDNKKIKNIIDVNNKTINNYKQTLANIKKEGIVDKEKEIELIKQEIESKRDPYKKYKSNLKILIEKITSIETLNRDLENQKTIIFDSITENKIELKNLNRKIEIYNSGNCPTCGTDLKDEKHVHDLSDILLEQEKINSILIQKDFDKSKLILKITQNLNQKDNLYKDKSSTLDKIHRIEFDVKSLSKQIEQIKKTGSDISIADELLKNIEEYKIKNHENDKKIENINNKIIIHEQLKNVFSNKGVRKSIIKNIIKPINVYLKDILDDFKSIYNVKIDENFEVKIYERMFNEIHVESLSMGEAKKINISLALSYLKLILKFRKLNILFLDEVFSSMQPENVELALDILKNFTKEFNLNIIIIDPKVYFTDTSLGTNKFDRIIRINKEMSFSNITET